MLSSNPKDLSLVTKLALYTRPSRSGEKGIRDKCFVNFAAKEPALLWAEAGLVTRSKRVGPITIKIIIIL